MTVIVEPDAAPRTSGGVTIFESAVLAHAAYSHDVLQVLKTSASLADLWRVADYFTLTDYGPTLRAWVNHVPRYLRVALMSEDAIWRDSQGDRRAHELFDLREDAWPLVGGAPDLQLPQIDGTQNYGFFVGAAWADELLSDRLTRVLWSGLRRHGCDSFGHKRREIGPHPESFFGLPRFQSAHHDEFQESLILPIVRRDPEAAYAIWVGLQDRLARAQHFLDAIQVTIERGPRKTWNWMNGTPANAEAVRAER